MKTQTGMSKRARNLGWAALAVMSAGAVMQIPSCEGLLTTVNPCGTVLAFCDEREIDALFAGIPAFELDPTCTIPFFGVDNPQDAGDCATVEIFPTTPGPRP